MKRRLGKSTTAVAARRLLAGAVIAGAAVAVPAQAQQLYVFSSGALTLGKGFLQNLAPIDPPIVVPVGFFVIKHPKGNVLFDTGNNDKLITDESYWGAMTKAYNVVRTPDVAIDTQIAKIGLKPDDIRYVVASHLHLDHGGNVGKFPNSTLVVQKDELKNAGWPEPGTAGAYVPGDTAPLRGGLGASMANAGKIIALDGDMDLFNDGTVIVKRWVAHTPGSQFAVVKLPKTGTMVLTGDNLYLRENLDKNIPPNIVLAYKPDGVYSFYEYLRRMIADEKATIVTAHDPEGFKAMKKAPEFYD